MEVGVADGVCETVVRIVKFPWYIRNDPFVSNNQAHLAERRRFEADAYQNADGSEVKSGGGRRCRTPALWLVLRLSCRQAINLTAVP